MFTVTLLTALWHIPTADIDASKPALCTQPNISKFNTLQTVYKNFNLSSFNYKQKNFARKIPIQISANNTPSSQLVQAGSTYRPKELNPYSCRYNEIPTRKYRWIRI